MCDSKAKLSLLLGLIKDSRVSLQRSCYLVLSRAAQVYQHGLLKQGTNSNHLMSVYRSLSLLFASYFLGWVGRETDINRNACDSKAKLSLLLGLIRDSRVSLRRRQSYRCWGAVIVERGCMSGWVRRRTVTDVLYESDPGGDLVFERPHEV